MKGNAWAEALPGGCFAPVLPNCGNTRQVVKFNVALPKASQAIRAFELLGDNPLSITKAENVRGNATLGGGAIGAHRIGQIIERLSVWNEADNHDLVGRNRHEQIRPDFVRELLPGGQVHRDTAHLCIALEALPRLAQRRSGWNLGQDSAGLRLCQQPRLRFGDFQLLQPGGAEHRNCVGRI